MVHALGGNLETALPHLDKHDRHERAQQVATTGMRFAVVTREHTYLKKVFHNHIKS